MKDLIGKKVKGFKFEGISMKGEKYFDKIGTIAFVDEEYGTTCVKFEEEHYYYPLSQIEPHLVEETKRN
jgi:hypothetical protein